MFALIYFVYKLNMIPLLSLNKKDSGDVRINKIVKLIEDSQVGFHDISRMVANKEKEYCRLNMPFELGIDYGYKNFISKDKKILVLDSEAYRYQKGLSDLAGVDIAIHNNELLDLFDVLRDWVITEYDITDIKHSAALKYEYDDFHGWLNERLEEQEYGITNTTTYDEESNELIIKYTNYIDEIKPKEFMIYCKQYFQEGFAIAVDLK